METKQKEIFRKMHKVAKELLRKTSEEFGGKVFALLFMVVPYRDELLSFIAHTERGGRKEVPLEEMLLYLLIFLSNLAERYNMSISTLLGILITQVLPNIGIDSTLVKSDVINSEDLR